MSRKAKDHLQTALASLQLAITAAEEERAEAYRAAGGDPMALPVKQAGNLIEAAFTTYTELERRLAQISHRPGEAANNIEGFNR